LNLKFHAPITRPLPSPALFVETMIFSFVTSRTGADWPPPAVATPAPLDDEPMQP
jgi:hypothetical protein